MALGSRLLLPGTHPEPALGSTAGGGHLLWGEGAGGSMHGLLCLLLCGALGHSAQRSELCPAVCAGSQTHQPSPLCTHTHRLCTDLLKDGKQLMTWGLWIHAGTDHRRLRNPLFPHQPCPRVQPRQHHLLPSPHQPVPVQRGSPSSPLPPQETRGCGAAQRGLPGVARPGLPARGHLVLP